MELGSWARRVNGTLIAEPGNERELIEMIHVLADRKVGLNRDLALSRARLLDFGTVNSRSMTVEVGVGWLVSALDEKLKPYGLTLGPLSPGAMGLRLCDFLEGPWAGLRAIPGGRLEPICTSLGAVFPDGRQLATSSAPRSAAGPDLNALVLGGNGRIALATKATLRCIPYPEGDARRSFSFASPVSFVRALKRAISEGFYPWRVHVDARGLRTLVEVRWCESRGSVERDRELLQRCVEDERGQSIDPLPDEAGQGEGMWEHEATWDAVRGALERSEQLLLFRFSLATVVARGQVKGLPLGATGRWTSLGDRLLAFDPRGSFGGAS